MILIDESYVNSSRPYHFANRVIEFKHSQNGPEQKQKPSSQVGNNISPFCSLEIEQIVVETCLNTRSDGGTIRLHRVENEAMMLTTGDVTGYYFRLLNDMLHPSYCFTYFYINYLLAYLFLYKLHNCTLFNIFHY